MKARDIMTTNPLIVPRQESLSEAAKVMRDHDVGLVPVVDDILSAHLVGVITDRDITVRCVAKKHDSACTVGDHMTGNRLATAHPDDDLDTVLSVMEQNQVRRLPVVADDNRVVGMIAQADLARKVGPSAPRKIEEVLERVSAPHLTLT